MIPRHLDRALHDRALGLRPLRVYGVLYDHLSDEVFRPLKITWVANRAQVDPAHAWRSLRILVDRGYLVQGPREGRLLTYRLTSPPLADSASKSSP